MGFEDSQLVEKALSGDTAAFEVLVDRYRDAVCGVAYHNLGNFDDVQDAAQEAFVQAYLKLGQLKDLDKFGPWLRKIISNVCTDILRRRAKCSVDSDALDEVAVPTEDEHCAAVRTVVREALAKLSDKVRLTVTLAYINGYSHDEVASFLEIPVNTVRSRLQHAKKQLRQEMITMVDDVLHEDKPDEKLTVRIMDAMENLHTQSFSTRLQSLEDAMKLGNEDPVALRASMSEAIRRSDTLSQEDRERALGFAGSMNPEQLRHWWQGQILLTKIDLLKKEEMPAAADEIMDHFAHVDFAALPPRASLDIANMLHRASQDDRAQGYYQKALDAARRADDHAVEGEVHMTLGAQQLTDHHPQQAREHFTHACNILPPRGCGQLFGWKEVCESLLALLDEIDDDAAARLMLFDATCGTAWEEDDQASFLEQPGLGWSRMIADAQGLRLGSVLQQASLAGKMVPSSPEPSTEWSGHLNSWYFTTLRTKAAVKSMKKSVAVPAGEFDGCLLVEYVTKPQDLPEATHVRRATDYYCGSRLAWFAPGVGLVQLQAHAGNGTEALIQLQEFSVADSEAHFPLAVGNTWTYGWAGTPDRYAARETYRVIGGEDGRWYVSHYRYVYEH